MKKDDGDYLKKVVTKSKCSVCGCSTKHDDDEECPC